MTGWELAFTLIGTFVSVAALVTVIFFRTLDRVSANAKWTGQVDADRENFKEFMKEIRRKLDEIFKYILGTEVALPSSPIQLTDLGKKISEAIQAKEWAAELAEQFAGEVEGKDAYEIQELARAKCNCDMEMSEFRASLCRKTAFQHGLKLDQVVSVLGLELRDILLDRADLSTPG